jgi:hypothetical protein
MEGGSVARLWSQKVASAKLGKDLSQKCARLTPL